jgi:hypothetical protein
MMKRMLLLLVIGGITLSCVTYGYYDTNPMPAIHGKQEGTGLPDGETPRSDTEVVEVYDGALSSSSNLPVVVGSIRFEKFFVHPLFFSFPTHQRFALRSAALKRAEARYGCKIELVDLEDGAVQEADHELGFCCVEKELASISYDSQWHVLSLLLGGGLFGWVEKASLEAVIVVQPSTRQVLPSYVLYHLVSPRYFSVEFLTCCFD